MDNISGRERAPDGSDNFHEQTLQSKTLDHQPNYNSHNHQPNLINQQPSQDDLSDYTQNYLDNDRIVKHIMVIGFHHKHGYQVDYCYPPLTQDGPVFTKPGNPISLPDCWKTLPLLCLPDGSHNYDSDTIYFTMPDSDQSSHNSISTEKASESNNTEGIKTIFGIACYRQIQADKLLNRTDDMTRFAVQKSVCVLSSKPLFGLIRSKLEMITHAYFEELDFSKVKILKLTYENLNSLLKRDSVKENATFLGLSARQLVGQFDNNLLVLFKAMLLEKKILFYKSPVRDLCSTIMSMCSLFSGLLESGGLDYSTCDLQLSSALLEILKLKPPASQDSDSDMNCDNSSIREDKVFFSPSKEEVVIIKDTMKQDETSNSEINQTKDEISNNQAESSQSHLNRVRNLENTGEYEVISDSEEDKLDDEAFMADCSVVEDPYAMKLCRLKPETCGLPLQIFTRGSFCLPYLSISYLDLLSDTRVKSFVIGATNFLFKQKRDMYDIIVDMEENTIIINDQNLKRSLNLTTEDLRFMDYLSKHVRLDNNLPKDEFDLISNDITKWVGGDEWIRYHFRLYTLYLLKASRTMSFADTFNINFIQTWKQTTNNYKIWESTDKVTMLDGLHNKHPFGSTNKGINFNDMKLKLSYAVNSSDKGRIINQTLNGIGRWSIWNNIASAASSASTSIQSAAVAATQAAANLQEQQSNQQSRATSNDDKLKQPSSDTRRDSNA